MKLISWNVNGLRACLGKGFMDFFTNEQADCFCLQETKMQPHQLDLKLDGYSQYWNSAEKKGYSGVAVFCKTEPLSVSYGMGIDEHDHEGRIITCEFADYILVNCYSPNSQEGLARLDYRLRWEADFANYLKCLDKHKPVIICGDLNVAHQEIDLKNPKTNRKNAGFTNQERAAFSSLLNRGFTDSFRYFYPDLTEAYSWWSYRFKAREKNAGWRIDYFLCSNRISNKLQDSLIYNDIFGSDHCPVGIIIKQ